LKRREGGGGVPRARGKGREDKAKKQTKPVKKRLWGDKTGGGGKKVLGEKSLIKKKNGDQKGGGGG